VQHHILFEKRAEKPRGRNPRSQRGIAMKKQKTFTYWSTAVTARENQLPKVFWFFFSKKNIPSLRLALP
jgi:hypothetical protein